jgi:hypothetical protein
MDDKDKMAKIMHDVDDIRAVCCSVYESAEGETDSHNLYQGVEHVANTIIDSPWFNKATQKRQDDERLSDKQLEWVRRLIAEAMVHQYAWTRDLLDELYSGKEIVISQQIPRTDFIPPGATFQTPTGYSLVEPHLQENLLHGYPEDYTRLC